MMALTNYSETIPDSPYIDRSDEAEYARLTGNYGVGEVVHHDPEQEQMFEELGVYLADDIGTGRERGA